MNVCHACSKWPIDVRAAARKCINALIGTKPHGSAEKGTVAFDRVKESGGRKIVRVRMAVGTTGETDAATETLGGKTAKATEMTVA